MIENDWAICNIKKYFQIKWNHRKFLRNKNPDFKSFLEWIAIRITLPWCKCAMRYSIVDDGGWFSIQGKVNIAFLKIFFYRYFVVVVVEILAVMDSLDYKYAMVIIQRVNKINNNVSSKLGSRE